jgi:hypothetical protein
MEKAWTESEKNAEVLHKAKEERSYVRNIKQRKVNRIGHVLLRNRTPKHVIKGKTEGMGIRGKRRM